MEYTRRLPDIDRWRKQEGYNPEVTTALLRAGERQAQMDVSAVISALSLMFCCPRSTHRCHQANSFVPFISSAPATPLKTLRLPRLRLLMRRLPLL